MSRGSRASRRTSSPDDRADRCDSSSSCSSSSARPSPRPRRRSTAGATRPASWSCPTSRAPTAGEVTTYAVHGAAAASASTTPARRPARERVRRRSSTNTPARTGVAADLVRAVIQVGIAFNPTAVSPKGAMGLMQLMPATARELGVVNPFHPEREHPRRRRLPEQLLTRYDQNVELALAAYNAGPGSVEQVRRGAALPRDPGLREEDHQEQRPPAPAARPDHLQVDRDRRRPAESSGIPTGPAARRAPTPSPPGSPDQPLGGV